MALSFSAAQFGPGANEQDIVTANQQSASALSQAEAAVAIGNQNSLEIASIEANPALNGGTSGGSGSGGASSNAITLTTTTTDDNQVLDSIPLTNARTIKYVIQVTAQTPGGMQYSSVELVVLQDGTNAYVDEYGEIDNGGGVLSNFSAIVAGANVNLLVTPQYATTTYKAVRIMIAA